jgi:uncharacterized protein (DUF433 family)
VACAKIHDRGRGPEIVGTRITVFDILPYVEEGWHPSSIALWFDLTSEEVQAALQYIEAHREEVLATNHRILERIARGNPPEVEAKREGSRAKLQALRAQLQAKRSQEGNGASHSG